MRLAHDTELKLLNSSCLRQRVSCIHHSKAGQSTRVAAVLVSPSPDDVFTRLGHGAGTKSTQWDRRAKSGLVRNMEHGQCGHHGGRGVTSADICSSHHPTPDNGGQWTGAPRMMIGRSRVTA